MAACAFLMMKVREIKQAAQGGNFLTIGTDYVIRQQYETESEQMKNRLYIYDCLTCKLRVAEQPFMTIGNAADNTFCTAMQAESAGVFAQRGGYCHFFPKASAGAYSLNGCELTEGYRIKAATHYLLVLAGGCFVVWYGTEENKPDFAAYKPQTWYVYSQLTGEWSGGMTLAQLLQLPTDDCMNKMATFDGLGSYVFLLQDILKVADFALSNGWGEDDEPQQPERLLRCPNCCAAFAAADLLSIATHPELRGDSRLGEAEMQRFIPAAFDSDGFALDERGGRCAEQACPACHHKLPLFFAEMTQHIYPIIGVPGAGKSYYLATLVQELERRLPLEFGLPFRDADPAANEPLNDMRRRVFTATTPQDAYIGKTHLRGRLYQEVHRNGRSQHAPRPFIYTLNQGGEVHSTVFYDHAGASFDPTADDEQSACTDFLKVADGLLFLFDPTTNPGFRAILQDVKDPQIEQSLYPPGRQTGLLAEMEVRLRTALNLPPGLKVTTPLAIIIGKSDCWQHLLGPEPLLPIVHKGQVRPDNVAANSARLRELLFRIAPQICVNAEAISSSVCYFAASAFGHSPITFADEQTGAPLLGPQDANLTPRHITDPVLWLLSSQAPQLLPSGIN